MVEGGRACALADAQFVLARSHGFSSWPAFVRHLREVERASSPAARFEAAVDAIAGGDLDELKRLLAEEPGLAMARSPREHCATLLHYTAANGVEGYRQRTPANIVSMAQALLEAGAAVNAEADLYGGGATTLGLAATSVHPERAGVQVALLRLLLDHGASMVGGRHSLVAACLANGRGAAAEFLANEGAALGLAEAAGVGRMDVLRGFFAEDGSLRSRASREDLQQGFLHACQYGRDEAVVFLLEQGAQIDQPGGAGGQTGLHWAVIGGQVETVKLLIARGAPVEAVNGYGGTPVGQALWSAEHGGDPERLVAILEGLAAAGARLPELHGPMRGPVGEWLARRGV
jgi:hypothetical protein